MKRIIATGILGCALLGAGAAGAGPVTKFVFEKITIHDTAVNADVVVTIRAGTKTVKRSGYTVCEYFVYPTDQNLGSWEDNVFIADGQVKDYCISHYNGRS